MQRGIVFNQPLRHGGGLDRGVFDAGAELIREVGPRRERQDHDRHHGRRDEADKQLPIETRSDFAQQRAAAPGVRAVSARYRVVPASRMR